MGNFTMLDIARRTWILDLDLLKGGRAVGRVVALGTIWTKGKLERQVDVAAAAARKATLRELARRLPTRRNTSMKCTTTSCWVRSGTEIRTASML